LDSQIVVLNSHRSLRKATEILAYVGLEENCSCARRSTLVAVGALFSVETVRRHAEHLIALNANPVQTAI
jgi:hypothetical protein